MKRIMAALLLAAVLSGAMISSLASCSIKVEAADKTTTAALKKEFDADFYATKYPDIKAAFLDDPTFTDGTYNLLPEARWSTIINTPAPGLNVALDECEL